MYFPTSAARVLATVPALPNIPPDPIISTCPSPRRSLFCTLTRNGVTVWAVRPSAILAFLSRTPTSVVDHGENVDVWWSPDGTRIIIQTSESYLVLIYVEYEGGGDVYRPPPLSFQAMRTFLAGPGEGLPLQPIGLYFEGIVRAEGTLLGVSPRKTHLMFTTNNPPTIQRMPWPPDEEAAQAQQPYDTWILNEDDFSWMKEPDAGISQIIHARTMAGEAWITTDGRVYFVQLHEEDITDYEPFGPQDSDVETVPQGVASKPHQRLGWQGTCIHDFVTPKWVQKQRRVETTEASSSQTYQEPKRATAIAINTRFSIFAVGTYGGDLEFKNFPSQGGVMPKSQVIEVPNPFHRPMGQVCALEWSSDGYVLAVGWACGWGVFSVGGRCLASGFEVEDTLEEPRFVFLDGHCDRITDPLTVRFQDIFMGGIKKLFWGPGNFELFLLARQHTQRIDGQLFAIPFAKSATTGQHSPDNTRYAFLQMDDRALVYRGADQPDMSVINPESDVWQHIKIPQHYLANNWPIRYSSISTDGRLVGIAGRRGLIHYSSTSGRWKVFSDEQQEQAFAVRGGLLWFHHVLIAAVEVAHSYQLRLYSRDLELSNTNVLHREILPSPVVILSLVDNSLLVYTLDNTLYHYLVVPTTETIKLHLCGSITFAGIIAVPSAVRMLSWMIPTAQKQLGDPVEDLAVAIVLMVVGGQLILLRPRKSADQEVKYDMQIFADRIEFCWIHLRGITALENSLWAYDAHGIRIWLNALAIEKQPAQEMTEDVKESVTIPLSFYPLSVLMDKGIIIGAENELATRSNLPFVMFRHATSSHLFLQHILLYQLNAGQVKEAVAFASQYKNLVFFAHALEILLHTVIESETTSASASGGENDTVLPTTIEFLDHFDVSLDVVVGCARKTEMTRWRRLFNVVGNPKQLFETCMSSGRLKTAGSYLLVLHNLEQLDENNHDAVRLLKAAVEQKEWQLCRQLLRFLHSIDESGTALRNALSQVDLKSMDGET
ncbi:RIC1-domain-containing protein [Macrolepiota fuliginosa MF-IS2]|uniref:RIC1-domain-containing protein n=1 Tax=Macrolepiota fuliginosa MF-IS2 TaxID=1400762 RepID=A0A9P5XT92_9AGAR|nr:RIC1-domain-containing protein [Macrolepiota fuliginosa MF-IS2]